jgi:nucleoside-diphosphate kinase
MALEHTLAIIKPDAWKGRRAGAILSRIEQEGFAIRGMRLVQLTRAQAEGFYDVHRGRPFFDELCAFMSSGPCVVLKLEAEGAIETWRRVIGATDPAKAADGTIRKLFGADLGHNAVHGSDAPETGLRETAYFFAGYEVGSKA